METLSRRDLLGAAAVVGGWMLMGSDVASAQTTQGGAPAGGAGAAGGEGPYLLPPLPYGYADLEPHIDAQTVKLHHDLHHAGYVRAANAALLDLQAARAEGGTALARLRALTQTLEFNLSGHILHTIFWQNMKKDGGGEPKADSEIGTLLRRDFGSIAAFEAHFKAATVQVEASGWGVLAYEPLADRVLVLQVEKHQNSLTWAVPVLACDVWEHAYYLKYQNRRSEYIAAFMNVINWDDVDQRLRRARGLRG